MFQSKNYTIFLSMEHVFLRFFPPNNVANLLVSDIYIYIYIMLNYDTYKPLLSSRKSISLVHLVQLFLKTKNK